MQCSFHYTTGPAYQPIKVLGRYLLAISLCFIFQGKQFGRMPSRQLHFFESSATQFDASAQQGLIHSFGQFINDHVRNT